MNKELDPYTKAKNWLKFCIINQGRKFPSFNEVLFIGDHNYVT